MLFSHKNLDNSFIGKLFLKGWKNFFRGFSS